MKLIWNILWRHLLLNQVQKICYCPATLQKVTCRCPIRSHLLDSYRWHTELLQTIGINTNSQKHREKNTTICFSNFMGIYQLSCEKYPWELRFTDLSTKLNFWQNQNNLLHELYMYKFTQLKNLIVSYF